MPDEDRLAEVMERTSEYSTLLYDVLLHFLFLCLFATMSVGLEFGVEYFQPNGFEAIIFRAVQVVFGAATLGPVVIFVIRDLWVLLIKAQKRVEAARKMK